VQSRNFYRDSISFQSHKIPIKIYLEYRPGARFALGKKTFIFRIPVQISESKRQELIIHGKEWARKVLSGDPSLTTQFQSKTYIDGERIKCFDRDWTILFKQGSNYFVHLNPSESSIEIIGFNEKTQLSHEGLSKSVQKVFSSFYTPAIQKRSYELAEKNHFPLPKKVSLRYMSSRWGSCRKSSRTISLNTKLLLAPPEIFDSVILHELSHLIHANHSLSFWKLVKQCDPHYKKYNNWLKTHGNQLAL